MIAGILNNERREEILMRFHQLLRYHRSRRLSFMAIQAIHQAPR